MKRLFFVFVCFLAFTLTVNAVDLSAGIGADFGFISTKTDTNLPEPYKSAIQEVLDDMESTRWGISAFLDAQYFEANLGFKFFTFKYNQSGEKYEETDNFFNIGAKLKYPFKIGATVTLFPLVGFDYSIFTEGKAKYNGQSLTVDRDDLTLSDSLDRFSLNLGLGLDYAINSTLYIRGEFDYAILFNTETQKDTIDEFKSAGYDLSIFQGGPVFKIALGYKFNGKSASE